MKLRSYNLTMRGLFFAILGAVLLADGEPKFSTPLLCIAFGLGIVAGFLHFRDYLKRESRPMPEGSDSGPSTAHADPAPAERKAMSFAFWDASIHEDPFNFLIEPPTPESLLFERYCQSYLNSFAHDDWRRTTRTLEALGLLHASGRSLGALHGYDYKYLPQRLFVPPLASPPNVTRTADLMVDIIRKLSADHDIAFEFEISASLGLTIRPVRYKHERMESAIGKSKRLYLVYSRKAAKVS